MAHRREIPSLDGLRAISVFLVLLAHARWFFLQASMPAWVFDLVGEAGSTGVAMFFVISGYLITTLLFRELERSNAIDLAAFYFRRTLRIFPAFYVYLGVVALLSLLGLYSLRPSSLAIAALYLWTYFPHLNDFLVSHSWSLSIEEQFYLAWPLLLLLSYRKRFALMSATLLGALMPALRVLWYFRLPAERGFEFHTPLEWLDTLMAGCILAIAYKQAKPKVDLSLAWSGPAAIGAITIAIGIFPVTSAIRNSGLLHAVVSTFGSDIRAGCLVIILVHCIRTPRSTFGRFLNHGWIRHLGRISYSTYLWQQVFTYEPFKFGWLGVPLTYVAAEVSFRAVETPFLTLRDRFASRNSRRSP